MPKDAKEVYEEFAVQLCEWSETGKMPASGDQEIRYSLNLQKERLDKFKVKMKYKLELRGEHLDEIYVYQYEGKKYTNYLPHRSYNRTVEYWADGRRMRIRDQQELFAMVTYLNDMDIHQEETYCCPNCGSISEIQTLTDNGCPYCKTRFIITELFPKVTNYYSLPAYDMNEKESKGIITKWMVIGLIAGFICITPMAMSDFFTSGKEGTSLMGRTLLLAWQYTLAGVLGSAAGYMVRACILFASLIGGAIKQTPQAVVQLEARKKITKFITQMDPQFSCEYFWGKVQSLVKLLILTDDRRDLTIYAGTQTLNGYDTIIDCQFDGVLGLNRGWVEDGYCYLDLNVYMTNYYNKNKKIKKKSEKIRVTLCRRAGRATDYGFSINKVNCKNCGGSFDAVKIKNCPYCDSIYDLKDDDWVIKHIQ